MGQWRGRLVFLAILGLLAVAVGAFAGRTTGLTAPASPVAAATTAPTSGSVVKVHVSGMVVAPGVVDVAPDAIVADAIEAAGGLRPGASIDQINLAASVSPGDQIVVPGPDRGGVDSVVSETEDGSISLSRATAGELETLPGVGPVLAERIISFREQNGGFDVVEDLLEVPGIGEAKLAAIRDLVRP